MGFTGRKGFEFLEGAGTRVLLTKNYSEIIIFEKLRISRVISRKGLSFLEISQQDTEEYQN